MTVFFRLLLALPHLVWLALWTVAAIVVGDPQLVRDAFAGTPARAFHGSSPLRPLRLHVSAFVYLAANPFPGFTGEAGTYPLDLVLPERARQNRWKTGFRLFLVIPALIVHGALGSALFVAVFSVVRALVRGRLLGAAQPGGLRAPLQRAGQRVVFLLTDAYPHASPLEGEAPAEQVAFDEPA